MVLKAKKTYIYPNWKRPNLSANGVIGGDYFACSTNVPQLDPNNHAIWRAFDGFYPTSPTDAMFHSAQGATAGYIEFYNPRPLCVTNIRTYNQPNFNYRSSGSGNVEASNDGVNWDLLNYYVNNGNTSSWDIDLSVNTDYYKYYKINSNGNANGDGYWSIGEIEITATVQQEAYNPIQDILIQNKKAYKIYLDSSKPTPIKSIVTNEDIVSNDAYGSISDASAGSSAYLALDTNGLNYGNISLQGNPYFWYWTLPTGSIIENMDIELTNSNSSNTLLTVYQGTVSSNGKLGNGTGNSSSKTYNITNLTPTNSVIIIKSDKSANNPAQNVTMFVKNLVIKKPSN